MMDNPQRYANTLSAGSAVLVAIHSPANLLSPALSSSFESIEAAVSHYQDVIRSLQQQVNEANQDMDDYTESTKELQLELESELDRMDKSEREIRRALEAAEGEKEEWKVSTTNS